MVYPWPFGCSVHVLFYYQRFERADIDHTAISGTDIHHSMEGVCPKAHAGGAGKALGGVVLAMTDVFLISTHGNPAHLVISPVALASGELSAVALCIYMIAPENILKQFPTMLIMGWGQLISSLCLLPFSICLTPV